MSDKKPAPEMTGAEMFERGMTIRREVLVV